MKAKPPILPTSASSEPVEREIPEREMNKDAADQLRERSRAQTQAGELRRAMESLERAVAMHPVSHPLPRIHKFLHTLRFSSSLMRDLSTEAVMGLVGGVSTCRQATSVEILRLVADWGRLTGTSGRRTMAVELIRAFLHAFMHMRARPQTLNPVP